MHSILESNLDFKSFLGRPTFTTQSKDFWENELVAVELIIDLCRLIFPGDKGKAKILKTDAPGKWKTNGLYFPKGMGGAFILFHSDDYPRSAVTGNSQEAPSPAKWKYLQNFRECGRECKSSHTKSEDHWMIATLQQNVALLMIYPKTKRILQHFNPEFMYNYGRNSRDSKTGTKATVN